MNLRLGDMSGVEYEQRFMTLASFVTDVNLPESMLAKIFEDRLKSCIKGQVSVQRLRRLRDVI